MSAPSDPSPVTAMRGATLSFAGDPFVDGIEATLRYSPDAVIVMREGRITAWGDPSDILPTLPAGTSLEHYRDALITAGFVDTHAHYPQLPVIAAHGEQLLDWLNRYVFPAEQAYAHGDHARTMARLYLGENLRNGITTASVFCTVHPGSVDALFEASEALNLRTIAGKVLMDRNAPSALCDTAQRGYDQSRELIARWHGRGRQLYAITPRFAPSSTEDQLAAAGALWREHPHCHVQSHLSENRAEVDWVRQLFPQAKNYLDVYDRFGLLGPRAIYGHGIHLEESELCRCHATRTALAHCPTSNLFLGSGLFDLARAKRADRPLRVGLGTDVGAGTSLSPLQTLNEAYKVAQLTGSTLSPGHAFYLATRGGAHALDLDDRIGSLAPGMEADLAVLDLNSTPLIAARMRHVDSLDEALFVQMMLADDRAIRATWVAGRKRFDREAALSV